VTILKFSCNLPISTWEDFMVIYAGVIGILLLTAFGSKMGENNYDVTEVIILIIEIALLTPIFGRIFGWW
jgi:hypothetical protein